MTNTVRTIVPVSKEEIQTTTGFMFYRIAGEIILLDPNGTTAQDLTPMTLSDETEFKSILVEDDDVSTAPALLNYLENKAQAAIAEITNRFLNKIPPIVGDTCIKVDVLDSFELERVYMVLNIDNGICTMANIHGVIKAPIDEVAKVTITPARDDGGALAVIELTT